MLREPRFKEFVHTSFIIRRSLFHTLLCLCTGFFIVLSTPYAFAMKPGSGPTEVIWSEDAVLTIEPSGNTNLVTWVGSLDFSVFGYDVHYSPSEPATANNATRIETGAKDGEWLDVADGSNTRCVASNYYIQAYSRGRKTYSTMLQASSNSVAHCENTGGGGTTDPGDGGGTDPGDGGGTPGVFNPVNLTGTDLKAPLSFLSNTCLGQDLPWEDSQGDNIYSYLGKNGYEKGFYDEFDQLNAGDWNSAYAWGPETIINNESQYYIDSLGEHSGWGHTPFDVIQQGDNGYLVIRAIPSEAAGLSTASTAGQPYVSGVLTTREKHDFVRGYFEARIRVSPGNGTWSAFWLNHTNFRKTQNSEADIIEYLGQSYALDNTGAITDTHVTAANKTYNTRDAQFHTYWHGKRRERTDLHYTNSNLNPDVPNDTPEWCAPGSDHEINFSESFHTYGFLWERDRMIWFIDGIEVFQVPNFNDNLSISTEEMYIVLNLALGRPLPEAESWPGAPDDYTHLLMETGEVATLVDYVRVWQQP